jgi:tetratricopeptide (TPR) repeat protein
VSRQVASGDLQGEGRTRNNLGIVLMQAGRYDEARRAVRRAIECKEPYGNAAQSWTSWGLLRTLEQAVGNQAEAERAWHVAFTDYLNYRGEGGHGQQPAVSMCRTVADAIKEGTPWSAERELAAYEERAGSDPWLKALLRKLHDVANGARDPSLALDPNLDYDDAAELLLLITSLGKKESAGEQPKRSSS